LGGLLAASGFAYPLLRDNFVGPLDKRNKDGWIGKARVFAFKISFQDRTGL
jgi:hypothetical protein